MPESDRQSKLLPLIGVFKLAKAMMLFTVAIGLHRMLRADAQDTLHRWVRAIRVDADNQFVHTLIAKITGLSDARLKELSAGSFLYGAFFATEGVGLLLRRRWAEYVALVSTAGFLPLEVYEVIHHFTAIKGIVLLLNTAIVIYLAERLWKSRPTIPPITTTSPSPADTSKARQP